MGLIITQQLNDSLWMDNYNNHRLSHLLGDWYITKLFTTIVARAHTLSNAAVQKEIESCNQLRGTLARR
jgi:hypothetical protein